MKRTFVLLLAALLGGAGLIWLVARGSGYVLINYAGYQLEMSFWTALLALMALLLLVRWGFALLGWLLRAGGVLQWWRSRRQLTATSRREQGLAALASADWPEAKRLLAGNLHTGSARSDRLLAARALLGCGEPQAAKELLSELLAKRDRAALLVAAQGPLPDSERIKLLEPLSKANKLPTEQSLALFEALLAEQHWPAAADLLKNSKFSTAQLEQFYQRWFTLQVPVMADLKSAQQCWKILPSSLRQKPSLVGVYTRCLIELEAFGEAEKLLLKALQTQLKRSEAAFDSSCLAALQLLPPAGLNKRLRALETLLQEQADAELAYMVARLCKQGELWARARDFALRGLELNACPAGHKLLAEIYLQLGDNSSAAQQFRRGLECAVAAPAK